MDHTNRPPPLGARDATLLRALRDRYPSDSFDEVAISTAAPGCPDLLAALDFLDARIDRRRRARLHTARPRRSPSGSTGSKACPSRGSG
jgi:hypothetical protein